MSGAVSAVGVGLLASGMGATALGAVGAGLAVGAMGYQKTQQAKSALKSQIFGQRQAERQAQTQADQAQRSFNRANQKTPDSRAALSAAAMSGRAGQSGTMLTGPQGVDQQGLALGRSSLLGS